jgi:hypothetical protein
MDSAPKAIKIVKMTAFKRRLNNGDITALQTDGDEAVGGMDGVDWQALFSIHFRGLTK